MTSAEKQRAYYAANREKKRAYFREWEARSKERRKSNPSRSNEVRRVVNQKWVDKNLHRRKGYQLKYRYGISQADFDRMMAEQGGRCAICAEAIQRVCVDHSHETGEVRAILCQKCNAGLGMFCDNAALLAKAFMYLTRFQKIGEVA